MSGARIILASASASRRSMLLAAGVPFEIAVPLLDEDVEKRVLLAGGADASALAKGLAERKALSVARIHPDALVIGSDQVLACEGRLFNKAVDEAGVRDTLQSLRGRDHHLITSVALVRNREVLWQHGDNVRLHMREFSKAFLDAYIGSEMPDILGSVGCYRIEGLGAQLFSEIVGDQFSIRGLPLLPLLAALRKEGALLQ